MFQYFEIFAVIMWSEYIGELTVLVGPMAEESSRVLGGLLVLRFVV
jgi:hypothetical protein